MEQDGRNDTGHFDQDGQAALWGTPAPPPAEVPFHVALLSLGAITGLGTKGLRALVHAYSEDIGHLWELPDDQVTAELRRLKVPSASKIADELSRHRSQLLDDGWRKAEELRARGVRVLAPSALPDRLTALPGGPLWLFVEGNPRALQQGPHAAVIGTRRPSPQGIRAAEAAVRTLAAYPITLVSGLANGIDAVAHQAALRDGVPNVAFLGHGIDVVFPAETAEVRERIIGSGGAVASEYLPTEQYRKAQFVQRNRLQAGLADLVVAAEGQSTGGSAHTVRFASSYRRPTIGFTWPGAGDLVLVIDKEPTGQVIDIFTTAGRRVFDALCRSTADSYGHATFSLSLVERQLAREVELRAVPPQDLQRLRQRLDELSDNLKDGDDGR